MSDTSMGTLTVRPSIDFLTHTWQPRRDLRRKHEVRLLYSQSKRRNPPPTLGCPVQDEFSLKLLLKICWPSRESSSQDPAIIQNKLHPLGKRCQVVRICLRGLGICCDQREAYVSVSPYAKSSMSSSSSEMASSFWKASLSKMR